MLRFLPPPLLVNLKNSQTQCSKTQILKEQSEQGASGFEGLPRPVHEQRDGSEVPLICLSLTRNSDLSISATPPPPSPPPPPNSCWISATFRQAGDERGVEQFVFSFRVSLPFRAAHVVARSPWTTNNVFLFVDCCLPWLYPPQ